MHSAAGLSFLSQLVAVISHLLIETNYYVLVGIANVTYSFPDLLSNFISEMV